ncbi:asparagine synthase (glutamine-hydrolyzing) [Desulfovirgula thermocuniculi]|uniref:asparagine synthase (glutamine-hydrolyzing) n=1 Tax=Desulfovirgula thermocuniculi TaxID=348842 RepID=UPI000484EE60|nr:asparagine synthase (glutamine-hydrolyzing) [Desulfovirgula thermocuniculi]
MCGITGWVDWEEDLTRQKHILENMTATLACRGPDAAGMWLSPRAAIGHRRLVVVDPAGGGQPMIRRRGGHCFVLTYNGELYNTPELREELAARGYRFYGHSDTEALLLAYMEWGRECVERLNGIFAFAVWDEATQTLFMARDRLGVKPLFYALRGRGLIFGSELKALLAHPAVKPEVDAEGLAEIFIMGPGRTPGHGVFYGVKELRPGHCLVFSPQGLRVYRYWSLQSLPHQDDLPTTAAKVRWLLEDAVRRQLVADVPVCTLLSGGVDSSAITAVAARAFREKGSGILRTFSVDYLENERYFQANPFETGNDTPWVEMVAEFLGTDHRRVVLDPSRLAETLGEAMRARDLPGMADIDSSLLLFCREVKKEATVALSGECADEIFGGYPWFFRREVFEAQTFPWAPDVGPRTRLLSRELVELVRPEEYVSRRYLETLAEVPRLPGESPYASRMRELLYLTMQWFMATLLDRKDRMSMACGLEVRVPFCDHRLVEYAWNIPWEMKRHGGMEKGILRLALEGLLPGEVLSRKKSPYPKTHHPAYLEAVRRLVLEVLDDPSSPLAPFIDRQAVRRFALEEATGMDRPWYGQLMRGPQLLAYLYQVDLWFREYGVSVRL